MNYRKFQSENISEISLGTWQLGSADWGEIGEKEAFAILESFVEAGGNFIDTADVYGMGNSEKTIGQFLKKTDKEIFTATKLGRRQDAPNGWPQNFGYDLMRKQVEESLNHLQTDQLFLEQLHCIPTEELKKGLVFDHLRRLQEEGLIRYWGVSVETAEEALLCLEQDGIASLQIIFNLFRQHMADELFRKAKEKDVSLIVRVPLASGLLTGKFSANTSFADNDHRNYNKDGQAFNAGETFSGIPFSKGVETANKMKSILPEGNMATLALRWILDHPEITTIIPGASRVEQVKNNMAASALSPLPASTHGKLRELYDSEVKSLIRGHY